jgi:alkylated DNA repair protein (DNA oxidative demethylase)
MRRPPLSGGELFGEEEVVPLAEGVCLLRGYARAQAPLLEGAIAAVLEAAPLRQMQTPGGGTMSVAMSNCGEVGWVSDRRGYRYTPLDPLSGRQWPAMPAVFRELACAAAERGGFFGFDPDACLINHYLPAARMSLHQDRDERDFTQPIVSVSLGLPAIFLLGGFTRREHAQRLRLEHGDVLVWGGPARLRFHGVLSLVPAHSSHAGAARTNLTFRKAR